MLCPWATLPWSSPIASVIFLFKSPMSSPKLPLALGIWPCFLCHREHGGHLLFTPSAFRLNTGLSIFASCSSRLGGRECLDPIEVSLSVGVLVMSPCPSEMLHFLWSASPSPCFVVVFLPRINTCLSCSCLKHRPKKMDLALHCAMFSFSLILCFSLDTQLCTLKEESVALAFHSFFPFFLWAPEVRLLFSLLH